MEKRAAYTILCFHCKNKFPIVVMVDPEQKAEAGVSSREVSCPFCQTLLTFQLNETLANNDTTLKSFKKE